MPPRRPLAPDPDRARSPEELLDTLRLRLSQLADNHPSRRAELPAASPEFLAEEERRGPEDGRGPWDDCTGPDDPAAGSDEGRPGWIGEAIRAARLGDGAADLADMADLTDLADLADGALGAVGLPGAIGHDDPYRPWFMAGDPGDPWWAGTDEPWD